MSKDYDVHHVQTLEKWHKDLDSLSLNVWLTTEVSSRKWLKMGDRCPPRSL